MPPAGDSADAALPREPFELTIYLRPPGRPWLRRPGSGPDLDDLTGETVTREQLEAERAAAFAAPIAVLRRFAQATGLDFVDIDPLRCQVHVRIPAEIVERVLGVQIGLVEHLGARFRCPLGPLTVPPAIASLVQAIVGLDERPHVRKLRPMVGAAGGDGLLPSAIAGLYGLTAPRNGAGQCVAIIEPAGGYSADDLKAACQAMNVPVPEVVDVSVDHGHNDFGQNAQFDQEVGLDIQVVAGVAPAARIAIYFTTNSERGLADAVAAAVHDKVNRPSVVLMTWGEAESAFPRQARIAMDSVLADAAKLGVTVVAAAGDFLATDQVNDGKAHVDYPASSPYVLGCGGTAITLDASGASIAAEAVWNDGVTGTGGGISDLYLVPAFQHGIALPPSANGDGRKGRGVPDVAAAAAAVNGYRVVIGGATIVASGTSAVAPLWGASIALANAERGKPLGFLNTRLYQQPPLLRPITEGNNIQSGTALGYPAAAGWSACTGLGVPKGADLIRALTAIA